MLYKTAMLYNMRNSIEPMATSELRKKTSEVMRDLQNGGAPICLTNYSKTVGYLISPDHVDPLIALERKLQGLLDQRFDEARAVDTLKAYAEAWDALYTASNHPFHLVMVDALEAAAHYYGRVVRSEATVRAVRRNGDNPVEVAVRSGPLTGSDSVLYFWFSPFAFRLVPEPFPGTYLVELVIGSEVVLSREVQVKPQGGPALHLVAEAGVGS